MSNYEWTFPDSNGHFKVGGRMLPCVMCAASPQRVGIWTCSEECEDALDRWIEEDGNEDLQSS